MDSTGSTSFHAEKGKGFAVKDAQGRVISTNNPAVYGMPTAPYIPPAVSNAEALKQAMAAAATAPEATVATQPEAPTYWSEYGTVTVILVAVVIIGWLVYDNTKIRRA